MKIAIVDHMVNPGGGSRVLRNLLPAIKKLRPEWELVFYANYAAIKRERLEEEFSPYLKIKSLKSVKLANMKVFFGLEGGRVVVNFFQRRFKKFLGWMPYFFSGAIHKEVEALSKEYDLIFCPWPFLIECPRQTFGAPVVAIFHDFNFRYYFNGSPLHPTQQRFIEQEIPRWLKISIPVVSTHFMKRELEKFYPEFRGKAHVIHLSSLGAGTDIDVSEAKEVVKGLGVTSPYILYPTNISPHKNIGALLSAFYLLKSKYPDLKLVLAGFKTEVVNGRVGPLSLEVGPDNRDVIGLGHVTNLQIDSLIQCAIVVVSTSLYEAGCGPGLDAWSRGVPVAMSNIPSFTEHLEVQGVRAQIFDPKSSVDIAEKIDYILSHPEEARADALYSQERMNSYNWSLVAQKYIDVFEGTHV